MKLSGNVVRLIVFIVLSIISISLILFLTVNEDTYKAIRGINPIFLVYCFLIWFINVVIDSIGMIFFVRGTGERIRFLDACKITCIRVFFNLITPFTFGGQPLIVYVLNKFGVPGGKGTAVVMTRLICMLVFTLVFGVIALVFFNKAITDNAVLGNIFSVTVILTIFLFVLLILLLLFPPIMKKIIKMIGYIGNKISLVKNLEKFNSKSIAEIYNMRNSFKNFFSKYFGYFILGFICIGFFFAIQIIIIYVIINGVGVYLSIKQGLASSSLLYFCISFMPTPGSSGLGEGFFVLIFQKNVPIYLVGIVVVLWRFFFQYLTAFLGAISSARFFSKAMVKPGRARIV
ncbi:MAG: flippase-like domain-containing protein [Spirochaetales bacterium]|nr:flippase-like domain-containing protein [Spirochaetales bacterium]